MGLLCARQRVLLIPQLLAHFHRMRSKKAFIPLKEARTIGILADLRNPGHMPTVVKFAQAIHRQDRRCHVLAIIPDKRKEVNSFDYEKNFPGMPVELVCQDELSLFKAVRKLQCKPFTDHAFDIVFYLETQENFALGSVLWQSQARMFSGPEGLCGGVLDFEISMKERTDLSNLSDNLIKYLLSIQNRQEFKAQPESVKSKIDPVKPQTVSVKPQAEPLKLF
jgi:hypothetical protein